MESKEPKYRWASPYEWLEEKAKEWSAERVLHEFLGLAREAVDSDTLQDGFQDDMEADGYFVDIGKVERVKALINNMPREKCVTVLNSIGINCDDEPTDDLREAVQSNFDDETLSEEALNADH